MEASAPSKVEVAHFTKEFRVMFDRGFGPLKLEGIRLSRRSTVEFSHKGAQYNSAG